MTFPTGRPKAEELKDHIDEELDAALEGTFPASDPIAPVQPEDHDFPER